MVGLRPLFTPRLHPDCDPRRPSRPDQPAMNGGLPVNIPFPASHAEAMATLLGELVRIPSLSTHEDAMATRLANEMRRVGFADGDSSCVSKPLYDQAIMIRNKIFEYRRSPGGAQILGRYQVLMGDGQTVQWPRTVPACQGLVRVISGGTGVRLDRASGPRDPR